MAVRDDFTAGEVLAAADLNDTFASKLDLAGGKILQIVRATDSTARTTTSTATVDANISVTITPQKSDSAIILIWSAMTRGLSSDDDSRRTFLITDSSDNPISGAQSAEVGIAGYTGSGTRASEVHITLIGYATPATTSATTYKGRFRSVSANCTAVLRNANLTGQMYAIEVSA